MKQLRKTLVSRMNMLLATMIAALGVVGCSHQKAAARQQKKTAEEEQQVAVEELQSGSEQELMVCMYGVPRAQYNIQGVVKTPDGKPLIRKEIVVSVAREKIRVETDEAGMFKLNFDGFPADEMTVEIDGEAYTEKITYDGEPKDAWDRGPATMKVQIIHSSQQVNQNIERPIMVKYGVPPTRLKQ